MPQAWEMVKVAEQDRGKDNVPDEVSLLLKERAAARVRGDWSASDSIRQKIADLGWLVQDTLEGQKVVRQS